MGTVWLARMSGKLGFERLVALKTILPTYSTDRQFCDMFLDEAKIAAGIDHENVARILEIGEDRGFIYYAMELIDGESLRKLYRDVRAAGARFPIGVALRIVADACAGLHATHELRDETGQLLEVVHRDVSPQNLLVSIRGTTKLIDFGVAKANARRSEDTAAGTLKGKIEYMAPEQARADALDRRADVYSMGAVLYELLASRPVRDTDEGRQLAALHELMTGVAYPPLPNDVPYVIRSVVDRALARDPASRFSSADELRHTLEQAMLATGQGATTDDVAALLAQFSRERTAKRKNAIERAIAAAEEGRLNAATLIAPVSQRGGGPHSQRIAHAGSGADGVPPMGPAGPVSGSGPYPLVPPGYVPTDGPVTGPSMRTIGPAAVTTRPAVPAAPGGGGAAKVVAAVFVLALVGLLGVVGGVLVTRRSQATAAAAASPPMTAVPMVSPSPADTGEPLPPPIEIDPPPGAASPAAPGEAPSARTGKDAGAASTAGRRPTGPSGPGRPAKPGGNQGGGDEYGF